MPNKRRHPRFTVEGLIGKVTSVAQVEILNLSLSGVAIKADQRLNIGRDYTIRLELGDRLQQVRGTVMWSVLSGLRPDAAGESKPQYSAGLRFTDVLNEKLLSIMEFIDAHRVIETEERRGGLRFQIDATGRALLDHPERYRVKLISLSGMLVEAERELQIGTEHPMELLPEGQEAITFRGRIAPYLKVLEEDPKRCEIGVEFVDMTPENEARLRAFIRALSESEGPPSIV